MTKAKKTARKPRQTEIPGTERKRIAEIDELAETYRDARDKRMKLQQNETELQSSLHEAMKKHGVSAYRYLDDEGDEEEVKMQDKVKISVRKVRQAKAKADE